MPVAQLSDHRELEVLLQVSEQEVDRFREDSAPARVSMARMSQPIQGTITAVGRRGDMANRFTVRIDLPGATDTAWPDCRPLCSCPVRSRKAFPPFPHGPSWVPP